jgi:hypothetical protein
MLDAEIDWRIQRHQNQVILGHEPVDRRIKLAEYR